MRASHRCAVASLACVVVLTGCARHGSGAAATGEASSPSGSASSQQPRRPTLPGVAVGPNKSFAKVTYRPEVKTIEEAGFAATLAGATADGLTLAFHNAPPDIRALKAGDVLLIKNQLARKVIGAQTEGEDTYLVTSAAMITDLVADGEIAVDVPLLFSRGPPPTSRRSPPREPSLLNLLIGHAYAQSPEAIALQQMEQKEYQKQLQSALKSAILADWKLTQLKYATADGLLNFSVELVKNYQGFIGKVAATGFVNNFDFWSNINVKSGLLTSVVGGIKKMSGKLHFDWEVAKQTSGGWGQEDLVKLPGALSIPLSAYLSGMPLTLEVSSALVIHPALTGGKEISTGGFTITLGGRMTASITSGGAVDQGSQMDQTIEITNDGGLSAVAPNAMVIAYAAPRIELTVDLFGTYKDTVNKLAEKLDKMQSAAAALANKLMPGVDTGLNKVKASNVLKSNADVYAQLISTEGTVHSPAISMVPCSRKWISFEGVVGTAANIAGLTPDAKRSVVLFQKRYDKADPPSNFCEKVGS